MKGNNKKRALLCIAILLFAFNFIAVQNVSADPTISITDNSGFIGYPGSGTPIDPYRIENFTISAALAHGISIQDTDAYFVIKNCTVYDGGSSYDGIYLENVTHGSVENCTVYNNTWGIGLSSSCYNNTLTGNTAYNNTAGIFLSYSCSNNTLTSNTAYNNTYGIFLSSSSSNNTLTSNTACNNTNGIYLSYSSNNTLASNTACNNTNGIYLWIGCNNNTLTGNIADHNVVGIHLQENCNNNTLASNTAYNGYGIGAGIVLEFYNYNNTLTSNTVYDNYHGFYFYSSHNNTLTGNTAYNNTRGINLDFGSSNNTFSNNYVHNYVWDFYSAGKCMGNVVHDLHLYCYPTNISFTYDNGIAVVGVPLGTAPPDPSNQANLSMYVNVTNVTPMSWILLNVSYADSDVVGVNESSLMLYRWNGTAWELADGSGVNGVDTLNNYIYANITEFSIFGSFGTPLEPAPQPNPVGGFVLPAEAPAYAAMFIILAIAAGAAAAALARKRLPP